MDKIIKFKSIKENPVITYLLVLSVKDGGIAKNGSNYVTADLFDGEAKKTINFFDYTEQSITEKGLVEGAIIKIQICKNGGYYNQKSWGINDDPSITKEDFVHTAPIDPDKSFDCLIEKLKSVDSNPDGVGPYKSLSHLTVKLLLENETAFKRSSAAVSMHHNYLHGLLYHTIRMVLLAEYSCGVYKILNKELLMCAAALHDIGKISCYETEDVGEATVTVEGRLFDHALTGIMMIREAVNKEMIENNNLYDPEKVQMLEHTLASHHGRKDWDAITTPAIPEAEALHLIDMMDSRINMFEEAYSGQEPGTLSENKVFGLENSYIYKPSYMD